MAITHLCSHCGYALPADHQGRRNLCDNCRRKYEREKSQRRQTEYATRVRDSLAWKHARALARRRDGGCAMRSIGNCHGRLEVHHRTPLAHGGNNALDNLLTLCRKHHSEFESRSFSQRSSHPQPHLRETERKVTGGQNVG